MHLADDPRTEARRLERYRAMSPAEKLAAFEELNAFALDVLTASLMEEFPEADETELFRRRVERMHGPERAARILAASKARC
jgi:hypothetical protein